MHCNKTFIPTSARRGHKKPLFLVRDVELQQSIGGSHCSVTLGLAEGQYKIQCSKDVEPAALAEMLQGCCTLDHMCDTMDDKPFANLRGRSIPLPATCSRSQRGFRANKRQTDWDAFKTDEPLQMTDLPDVSRATLEDIDDALDN
ncbi:hypothetical protein GWK47_053613 [Chionoecetes opilio]|uniref:Uncharacterized protein n=1 Tax=Chionoecetes opilio TaxID=41210 RepID=A0A8J5CS61_CHIOP|nr:hypothetical protein GWK47_053613 [Chionoecetes opilio]